MTHIAIDLGARKSQLCVRNAEGEIVQEGRVSTQKLAYHLQRLESGRVILETCSEAFKVAAQAEVAGHEVRVVPAMLARTLGVGERRIKTDQRDARALSLVSARMDLPGVHIPSEESQDLKSRCGMRDALVGARTKLINNVRGYLRRELIQLKSGGTRHFTERVRKHFEESPPSFVGRQLLAIDALSEQIDAATKDLEEIAKTYPIAVALMTVPGVGPITSLRFIATIDDVGRFESAHALESYLGLTPGEHSSGDRKRITSITKAGSSAMRWTLIQAAWTHLRVRPGDPTSVWASQVAVRRGKHIAVTALARKLAGILFAIWRDGSTYRPIKKADMPTQV
jgi:transposase